MKTFAIIFLAITAVIAGSCSKDNSTSPGTQKSNLSSGAWTVSYFTDSGKDETSDYSGYSFSFNTGGTLSVTGSGTTFTGSWSIKSGSSSYGSSDPDKLVITISGNKQMDHVSKDWKILKMTSSEIQLTDDNPSSAEVLHFSR